jgi:importin subunit beta-1
MCVSAVGSIEIPNGRWGDLVETLVKNSTHEKLTVRLASVTAIGYLCEELDSRDTSKEQKDYLITALLNSLEDPELLKVAVTALYNAIEFTIEIFEAGQGKIIMDEVYKLVVNSVEEIQVIAMQCLVEIVRFNYKSLAPFGRELAQLAEASCNKDPELVRAQAIEVWTSIAEEEVELTSQG